MGVLPAVLLISTWSICADFNNIGSSPPDLQDWNMLHLGCDYGHDIAWMADDVLYLVGSSGGYQFDRECPCPSPGPSYCELTSGPLGGSADATDGMIARFDLEAGHIGLREERYLDQGLLIYPSPTEEMITISHIGSFGRSVEVTVLDATGRVVLATAGHGLLTVDVLQLASGVYTVELRERPSDLLRIGRFIRR